MDQTRRRLERSHDKRVFVSCTSSKLRSDYTDYNPPGCGGRIEAGGLGAQLTVRLAQKRPVAMGQPRALLRQKLRNDSISRHSFVPNAPPIPSESPRKS